MKRSLWIPLLLAVLLFGGGGYYLFTVAWPARYARAVLALDREFRANPAAPRGVVAQIPSDDEEAARRLVGEQRAFLTTAQKKIADLRPAPRQYRQLQEDLEAGIDFFLLQNAEIERRIEFIARAKDWERQFQRGFPTAADVATVGDALAIIDREFPRLKAAGDALFRGELPQAPEVREMKTAWANGAAGFEALIAALREQPRERLFRDAAASLARPELREAERAANRFTELLRNAASSPPGSVFGSSSLPSLPPDVNARLVRALDGLKQQYPEYAY